MKATGKASLGILFFIAFAPWHGAACAQAQMAMPGGGRSLGGYGAGAWYGGGGTAFIPYAGNGQGFLPYSAGRGGLGVQPIPRRLSSTTIGGAAMAETPIGGASLQAMSGGATRQPRIPFGYEARAGMGRMAMPPTRGMSPRRPYGPGLSSPFRVPPAIGAAGGMAMP